MPLPRRLAALPSCALACGLLVRRAESWRARLLGLAWLRSPPLGVALWLPGCRSVHTFGMRFALDLVWLDPAEAVVRVDRAVPPRRVRACRAARSVVELPVAPGALRLSAGAASAPPARARSRRRRRSPPPVPGPRARRSG